MRASFMGLVAGLALGFAGAFGGFGAFIVVLFVGLVGFFIGLAFDRGIDVRDYLSGRERARR